MKKIFLSCALVFAAQSTAFASRHSHPSNPAEDLPRFYEVVKDQIYRGAQPTDQGFVQLSKSQIRSVLDLRNEDPNQIATEGNLVQSLGMNFISIPLSGFFAPSDKDMNQIQQILNNKSLQPIFVHCQHGQDRTGLVIGLYRVFTQKESANVAEDEMLSLGFHEILLGLNFYFNEKTYGL